LKFTLLVVKAQTDHPITVLNLISIDVIDLLAAVLLAGESGRAVVVNDLLVKAGGASGLNSKTGSIVHRFSPLLGWLGLTWPAMESAIVG
jgi:hypothetical protein